MRMRIAEIAVRINCFKRTAISGCDSWRKMSVETSIWCYTRSGERYSAGKTVRVKVRFTSALSISFRLGRLTCCSPGSGSLQHDVEPNALKRVGQRPNECLESRDRMRCGDRAGVAAGEDTLSPFPKPIVTPVDDEIVTAPAPAQRLSARYPGQHTTCFSRYALKLRFYLKYGSRPRLISRTYPAQRVLCEIAAFIPLYYPSR